MQSTSSRSPSKRLSQSRAAAIMESQTERHWEGTSLPSNSCARTAWMALKARKARMDV